MATYTDAFSSGGATLKLTVTRESYSTKDNTSYLKCVLKITKDKDYSSYNTVDASISMTINGSKLYSSTSFDIRDLSIGSTKTLATKYITVSHNSDGTKSVSCKASFVSGVALGSASISATYTCETIPRKSTLTVSNGTLNTSQTLTISRQSTDFKHSIKAVCGSSTLYIKADGSTSTSESKHTDCSISFKLPISWAQQNTTGTTVSVKFTITTYNSSGSDIGSNTYTKSFTIPSSVKPGVPSISLEDLNGYYSTYGYVQNKSKVKVTTSASTSNCQGATIKSYTIYLNGNKCSSSTFTLSSSGENTIKVVATDTRGATNSNSIKIDVAKYSKPTISFTTSKSGSTLTLSYDVTYSSLGGKNNITITSSSSPNLEKTTIASKITQTSGAEPIPINPDTTYNNLYLTVTDALGGSGTSKKVTIFGSERVFNVNKSGKGLAIGKLSETDGFECVWNSRFYGNIYLNKSTSYMYGKTNNDESVKLLRLNDNNNVLISDYETSNSTFIYGGSSNLVNIGSSSHNSDLKVYGSASGPSGFSTSSDKRVKKNIKNLNVDIVDKLQSVEYQLINSKDEKIHYGFVAQDVVQVLLDADIDPETCGIIGTIHNGEDEQYVLTYTEFVPLLVTKCQTLQSEIDELRQEITELKQLII